MTERFHKRSRVAASADEVCAWHERPEAFNDLTPPGEPVQIVERTGPIDEVGSRLVLKVGVRPFRLRWVAEHTHFEAGRMFRDVQVRGPFARWEHTHRFLPDGDHASWLDDEVLYALPFGRLGRLLGGRLARRKLERLFEYRHKVTIEAFTTAC